MALTLDATSASGRIENTDISWSHTCSGSERFLTVIASGTGDTFSSGNVAGITYNGVAMTLSSSSEVGSGNVRVYIFTLVNPASGSNTIALTRGAASFLGFAEAISFNGVNQGAAVYDSGSLGGPISFTDHGDIGLGVNFTASGYAIQGVATSFFCTVSALGATQPLNEAGYNGMSAAAYQAGVNGFVWRFTYPSVPAGQYGLAVITIAASGTGVPDAPTGPMASAHDASASIAFTASASDGGSPITGYTATSTPGSFTGTSLTSPITVTGLTDGVAYTFTVHATNANGNSAESSASSAVTPQAVVSSRNVFFSSLFARDT